MLRDVILRFCLVTNGKFGVRGRLVMLSAESQHRRKRSCLEQVRRAHDVSILMFGGGGVGRFCGCWPRKKVSMMSMRLPQQGQGCSGAFGSSGLALAALMASIGMSGTARSARIRAIFLARVWLVSSP